MVEIDDPLKGQGEFARKLHISYLGYPLCPVLGAHINVSLHRQIRSLAIELEIDNRVREISSVKVCGIGTGIPGQWLKLPTGNLGSIAIGCRSIH